MKKEWFAEWFDSPYYHQLYKSRDENEAKAALDNLLRALQLSPGSRVLDLACGKGRHSRYLAEKGFAVTGLDISPASILFARQFEHAQLEFYQHDMRKSFRINYFDAVMNMFTSFGYFKTDTDHLLALKNVSKDLRSGGLFLLDYFNARFVHQNLLRSEEKTVDRITFSLKRWVRNGYVFKSVEFQAAERILHFQEQVRLFELFDFESLLSKAGLRLSQTYGDYDLSEFDPNTSKRLILIAEKP
ncbi:MAG: methyltransferase domain-containing protein [Saprospiraceae bacterium]|nr:methyltransferase domain-containing protein [Saprospiraceae bacterium]